MERYWLSEMEAIDYTGFSRTKLVDLRLRGTETGGTLPFYQIGGTIRYKRSEIDKFMENHKVN